MSSDDISAPDQAPGAPHPRETARLIGQHAAEAAFLRAYGSERLHHGWLISGPRGVGKATLAWRMARFLLATPVAEADALFGAPPPPDTLDIDPDHPVARRVLAGSDPGLAAITRSVDDKTGRLRTQIVAEDVRRLNSFFGLSAPDGGRRVVILDSADEMNPTAANALLKMLEEPPARTTLLLISHQPSRLLPTIRSRCRTLRLGKLAPDQMTEALQEAGAEVPAHPEQLAALADGSVGDALRLLSLDGLKLYGELIGLLAGLPQLDRARALKLAERVAQRGAAETFAVVLDLVDILLARLARTGATGTAPTPEAAEGEAQMLMRLSSGPGAARAWATVAAEISRRSRHGRAVNLDPASLVLDTVFKIQETAAGQGLGAR